MTPARKVPGEVTAVPRGTGYGWKWRSPRGTEHLGAEKFPSEKAALAAGRRFARRSVTAQESSSE
ncbi:hypothetical protein [Mycolicibacterium fortuitum]|uniref:hypothetical protein n=1 Tax=Mycolicibacterium fortuitum TaxID=1766 RepID=UPI000AC7CB8E|nr:hypothetical protein [Mycolicibacterium fortuitum]